MLKSAKRVSKHGAPPRSFETPRHKRVNALMARLLRNEAGRYAALPFCARWIASQTRSGVAGISIDSTPSGRSALMMAGGALMVPLPPIPSRPYSITSSARASSAAAR